ncbi:MAG: hypothetical protein ACD_13C00223G0005 [uncultured bacterium]|uniref:Uncharacterized protein n=1 Tax=Candidatus Woesebacteria bacterium GW2011_GWA1_40_43 TaxID=1618553 RepID=A0A0G0UVH2_9BACT|nr:MAG: hypothetical protein ACD_13C00223G0005 [uncultured bacterium]KKR53476.1 MAG: hypothetical protein UT88_C0009G0008 [Candidatus Woesebacteria bacterium GW2011_GWD2_40_19]KKR57121.1 MAG: hypothetical protein UT96_C0026G0006 [Candidatus Woesebacteria bacterium GW2011_GWC2_40_30]KKR63610.1 MAG: hypothetical protein UU02_C0022G0006 [Candidatus Woesebacteria bacterium GW2011_GWA1_40_43]HAU65536.1 hypothetical protein [Candidatus Woesebacteria bacterium]
MKKVFVLILVIALLAPATTAFAGGFDEYGYNDVANIFNGTGASWSLAKGLPADYLGIYSNDKLVMKWNSEWVRGNTEGWSKPPYAAWENNEWNGAFPGGSGAVWHYKIVWVGNYAADLSLIPDGAYGIWGQFAVIMDQGIDPSFGPGHLWFAHANPAGYGSYGN